jgi:hypothetical protein
MYCCELDITKIITLQRVISEELSILKNFRCEFIWTLLLHVF